MDASDDTKSSKRVYWIVFATYLYSFTNNAAISWSSPVFPQLKLSDPELNPLGHPITRDEESWLASLLSFGNMVGLIPYGYLCYKFGRKYTLTSLGGVHIIAFLFYTTNNLTCFYIGRFLSGVASGAGLIIFPMYISEICKDSDRGVLLVSIQIFSSCGTLFSYVAGNYLPLFWFNVILCIFPIIFVICFGSLATESPYYYVMKNDLETAKKVMVQVTSTDGHQVEEEIEEVVRAVEMTQTYSLNELLSRKSTQKAIALVYVMFIFQQLSGYMPLATYVELIVAKTKFVDPKISTIVTGGIFLLGSVISTFFVDHKGRKLLLYVSIIGIIISELVFSMYYFYFSDLKILPIICLAAFFLSYNSGLAYLPQIICAEILPIDIKFKVASSAGILGCGTAFIITGSFLEMNGTIGYGWTILFFAACSTILLIVIAVFLPETKGRSFRQIQVLLEFGSEMD